MGCTEIRASHPLQPSEHSLIVVSDDGVSGAIEHDGPRLWFRAPAV